MKKRKLQRVLALALTLCLCLSLATPVSAAGWSRSAGISWSSIWERLVSRINHSTPAVPETPAEPEEPEETPEEAPAEPEKPVETPEETPVETPEAGSSGELTLVEDETTVEEGTELRASTYALTSNSKSGGASTYAADSYTPVIMTYAELYNRYGSTEYYYLSDGEYYPITNVTQERKNSKDYYKVYSAYYENGEDKLAKGYGSDKITVYTLDSGSSSTTSTIKYFPVTLYNYDDRINDATHQLEIDTVGAGNLTQWSGMYFGGNDLGANVKNSESYGSVGALPYAEWNRWTGDFTSNSSKSGNRTYSGLVNPSLGADGSIAFTHSEAGIFNSDATVKDIYTNVELPFEYDSTTKYYTFDANEFGVYFHTDDTQGTSSTPSSNSKLYYNSTTPQSHNFSAQDQRTKGWFPFNDATSVTTTNADYFFGMSATIPFTMTPNGRMSASDPNSEPIKFEFSGDDDVWVFIDGVLVLDIGGVRNMLNGSIDFANNTWEITKPENQGGDDLGDAATPAAKLTGKLFSDEEGTGTLGKTRESFAATDSHDLTIFYLERGAGSSNCKIQFNLPMKDSVSVKKLVSDKDSAGIALDAETLAQINNRDFGFTLYKDGNPVANVNYSLLNENGQYISTPSTDANGHFTLKNGQTAKFVGEINSNSYYVVEDKDADADAFWQAPVWTYTAKVANEAGSTASTTNGQSMTVTATGSDEAEDSIAFTCTNTWVHQDNTSISAVDDKIVIDYGLPVVIDVLANDTVSNGTKSIESVTGAQYGTATVENGKIKYQLNRQLTGVEVLTYTAKVTGTGNSGNETTTESQSNTAKIYIIPATSMYYEENFADLVTFSDGWSSEGTAQTDPQEPGVVGTVGDSPYGSDAAYLNDSGDSNGSSKYVDTTAGPASFSYTFTGTGTSFFARTNNNSGYMRVVITDADGATVYTAYRDTSYKNSEGTIGGDVNVTGGVLYNIPVFTYEAEGYGTYTVTVSIAGGANAQNYGKEFWLDGIRVISPLNSADANVSVANSAYASDGEANMTVVTLRQKLIAEAQIKEDQSISWNEGDNFVLFTDTNGNIKTAEEYKSNGPKEEVYLNNGQSVTFSLTNWDPNTNKIYLGVKAPVGNGTVSINGNTLNINNAADCYYDISGYASITSDENDVKTATFEVKATSSLISVTNIKVTGNAKFTIVNNEVNKDVTGAE